MVIAPAFFVPLGFRQRAPKDAKDALEERALLREYARSEQPPNVEIPPPAQRVTRRLRLLGYGNAK